MNESTEIIQTLLDHNKSTQDSLLVALESRIAELESRIKTAHGFLLDYALIDDKDGSVERAKNVLEGE